MRKMQEIIMHKRKAFTLAEVLVTLAVIGVVSALTIPSLTKTYQNTAWWSAFKKEYSVLEQATKLIMSDENGALVSVFTDEATAQSKYNTYLKLVKSYTAWDGWHNANDWYYFDTSPVNDDFQYVTYLADGAIIAFSEFNNPLCDGVRGGMTTICGLINVDVNGRKSPNTYGKDIYSIYVLSNRIIPRGSGLDDAWVQDSCAAAELGVGCAAKVLKNVPY